MMWHSFLDGRLGLVKVMIMMWTPCMLREFNLVGCSYIVIIDYRLQALTPSTATANWSYHQCSFSMLLFTHYLLVYP
jgi:hypothetical protein